MNTLAYNRPAGRPARVFNSVLNDLLRDTFATPALTPTPAAFVPATDVLETAHGYELQLALPGFKKEALNIEFLDGQLVVSGERLESKPATPVATTDTEVAPTAEDPMAEAPLYHRRELSMGAFRRSFRLPDTVNVKAIAAELTDGILHVTLPFNTEKVTRQRIEVR